MLQEGQEFLPGLFICFLRFTVFWVYIEYNYVFMKVFEKIKRFIEPYEANYFAVSLSIVKFICWALYALFSVYVIREATKLYSFQDIA
jgi:hypothetical protein